MLKFSKNIQNNVPTFGEKMFSQNGSTTCYLDNILYDRLRTFVFGTFYVC